MAKSFVTTYLPKISKIAIAALLLGGGTLTGYHIYSLTQYSFVDATVRGSTPTAGKCRLRMGKYIDCQRFLAAVEYQLPGILSPRTAEIDSGEYPPTTGATIKIMVRPEDPSSAQLAQISKGWSVPLGMLFLGVVGTILYRFGRSGSPSRAS